MKLRAENIVKTYKGRSVVKGVSVEVNRGEIVGLLGPNGAGKTTSFYMIVGLVKPNAGNIYLDDMNITDFPMYRGLISAASTNVAIAAKFSRQVLCLPIYPKLLQNFQLEIINLIKN